MCTFQPPLACSNSHQVQLELSWIRRFHFKVQRQILLALEEFSGFGPVVDGSGEAGPAATQDQDLLHSVTWTMFTCHLLGVGTSENPEAALRILCTMGHPDHGAYWQTSVLLAPLHCALGVPVPHDRQQEIDAISPAIESISPFYCRIMGKDPSAPDPAVHGIACEKVYLEGLVDASSTGDSKAAMDRLLLNNTVTVGGGNTLLHAAAFYDLPALAQLLLDSHHVVLDAVNDRHETALLIACARGSTAVLDLLLDRGADAAIADDQDVSALYLLSSLPADSAEATARRLLANGAPLEWDTADEQWDHIPLLTDQEFFHSGTIRGGPLLRAVSQQDLTSLRILLQLCQESFPTTYEIEGEGEVELMVALYRAPLRLAAELHLAPAITLLGQTLTQMLSRLRRMDVPSSTWTGELLHSLTKSTAVLRGALQTTRHHVHRLVLHQTSWEAAARQTLLALNEFGFVRTHVHAHGGVPMLTLNYAIISGAPHTTLAALLDLPEIVAAVDVVDEVSALTPVHQAINAHHLPALQLLVARGATVDLSRNRDPEHILSGVGASYLHVLGSLRVEDTAFAELLMEKGVPPGVEDDRGVSALLLALTRGAFKMAELLIRRGAGIRQPGLFGLTPLGAMLMDRQAIQLDDLLATLR